MTLSKRILYNLRLTGGGFLSDTLNASIGTINNMLSTNISSGDIHITGNLFVGGTLVSSTANLTNANVTTGTVGSLLNTNAVSTNISSGTLNLSTGLTSENAQITNVVSTTISAGTLVGTTFTGSNMSLSGDLVIGGTLTTVNITTTNVVDTHITSGNINVTSLATILNANVTTLTAGNILATTSISSGAVNATNSTVTNIVATSLSSGTLNLSTGVTAATILATTSISSGAVNATNSTVTNIVATSLSSGTLNLSTGVTAATILATTRISSGAVNATNSTVTNIVATNLSSGTLNLSTEANVYGTLRVSENSSTSNYLINLGTTGAGSFRSGYLYGDGTTMYLMNQQNGGISFGTNNTADRLVINAAGNVGINTNSPGSQLDIKGITNWGLTRLAPSVSGGEAAIGFFALNNFTPSTQATSGNWILGTGIPAGGAYNFSLNRNTTNMMSVATNGNVGIGTSSPTTKLHVYQSVNSGVVTYIQNPSNGSNAFVGYQLETDSGAGGVFSIFKNSTTRTFDGGANTTTMRNDGGALRLQSNTGSGVLIDTSGNVTVYGSLTTNTMLIQNTTYSTTLASQVYNANTWYVAIAAGILTNDATYIVSLTFTGGATPWNIYTSFIHMIGYTNDNTTSSISGANVPTTTHANDGNDYQVKVRGLTATGSNSGIQFSVNSTTPSGSWTVKAYRII